jgi:2-C-methyl-D-erythritol 4-phosphate cytidylyltransferase/2-C-methyl-D-erythritol 2,4-cyclodiphosphate synthase
VIVVEEANAAGLGGERFAAVAPSSQVIVIHDAARPLVSPALIERTVTAAFEHGAAIAALQARDTVKRGDASRIIRGTLPREEIFLARHPGRSASARIAVTLTFDFQGGEDMRPLPSGKIDHEKYTQAEYGPNTAIWRILRILDEEAVKATFLTCGAIAERYPDAVNAIVAKGHEIAGHGYHHEVARDLPLEQEAEVMRKTVAMIRARTGRQIAGWRSCTQSPNSIELLKRAVAMVNAAGYVVANVDVVVIAQRPKLSPHVDAMRVNVARALGIDARQVSVKGKTNEGVDSTGTGDAIAVHAVALIQHAS